MPTFTMTKNWDDGQVLTESQLDDIKTSVETFLNTTKLDSDNIQDGGIDSDAIAALAVTAAKLANSAVETAKINDLAVTTAKIDSAAVTFPKLAAITRYLRPGQTINIGLEAATTTDANDSIQITSADGTALSSTNIGYICVPGTTAGTVAVLSLTADVKIKITGAHWGVGTLGNLTDLELRLYAINDNSTLKFGVSNTGQYRSITVALSSSTQTDINLRTEMLVDSTLSGTSACVEIGWFFTDFNDTNDVHTVQTGAGEINLGIPFPAFTTPVAYTPDISGFGTEGSVSFEWHREGRFMVIRGQFQAGTPAASEAQIPLPTRSIAALPSNGLTPVGVWYRNAADASEGKSGPMLATEGDAFLNMGYLTEAAFTPVLARNGNAMEIDSTTFVSVEARVPIVGWSN
jgi:hypothetical protein